ncbi:HWE histidine kinase domain-containing protein [Rhodalgimonas zhirmunskyi]|uniref:histidine kinase n=1 Tax=Rhodalgimonas zhirmunskyi TaxID=2964767 RepID=A0AAJ1U7E2_9RHOB|nr:HWE histidine kinase domain-containing protein [Rhodoalgimonas zhirmunskyi]MDQ2094861.1 GAF domain-containing protein [Rhodoalgimonas zhirmunskyi]
MSEFRSFPDHAGPGHEAALKKASRLAELEATGLMDSLPEEAYDRAVRLARKIVGSSVGILSLVDGERQFFKAHEGLDDEMVEAGGTPLSHSFCQYVVSEGVPLAVSDAREHPLLKDNGAVEDLGVVAYLGVPVRGPSGEVLGSFCAIEDSPQDWTEDQLHALHDLAQMIEAAIQLTQAVEERQLIVDELNHRVKNLFTVVSGMIRISRREAEDATHLAEILQNRVQALSRAHQLIAPAMRGAQDGEGAQVDLAELVDVLVEPYKSGQSLTVDGPAQEIGAKAATSLALALHEMATNSSKYGAMGVDDGKLHIFWTVNDAALILDWHEEGRVEQAKGAPSGFGSRLLQISIEGQLGGTMESTFESDGMRRRFTLPLVGLED